MHLATLLFLLYPSVPIQMLELENFNPGLAESGYTVVRGTAGTNCQILCKCKPTGQRRPVIIWCKKNGEEQCVTVLRTATNLRYGRVSMKVTQHRSTVEAWVSIQPLEEGDAGEYWCGFWEQYPDVEIIEVKVKIGLQVRAAPGAAGQLAPSPAANYSTEIVTASEHNRGVNLWHVLPGVLLVVTLTPLVVVGVVVIRRMRNVRKVGDAQPQDIVTVCKSPGGGEDGTTDIIYAVLTPRPRGLSEEPRYANIQPSRTPEPSEYSVEYSSIAF
ncbi:uncharacterized protein LOC136749210 [Amia ocellicauda]|uniref:uncharacterized protein LOC136749210 n=1 Tax=Amia ocellicauda TaxID=2972642 RepID=UPI003464A954